MTGQDWRRDAAAYGLTVHDLSEHVGSEIGGIDLSAPVPRAVTEILRTACAERVVLLFRGQDAMDPGAYVRFTEGFGGAPDLHTQRHYCLPEHHALFVVGNPVEDGRRVGASRVGLNWHTDH